MDFLIKFKDIYGRISKFNKGCAIWTTILWNFILVSYKKL